MANNTMTKLATTTVGSGGASSVTFSAIPQTYTDLVIKTSSRTNGTNGTYFVNFNGSNLGSTALRLFAGNGVGGASGSFANSYFDYGNLSSSTSNTFSNSELYIPNYTSNNFKSLSGDTVLEDNGTNWELFLTAGIKQNTNPITSITIAPVIDTLIQQYSEFTLYGVYAGGTTTPSAPTIASATDLGGGTAQVTISSPAAIPYTVTSSPGGITATGMSPIQISGLSPQTSYTFTAQAVAPFGVSAASSASSSVSMYNGMTALATVTLGSSASSITFSSIPSGYSHLQIRYFARGTTTNRSESVLWQMNGYSTNGNYTRHSLWGEGGTASSGADTNSNGGLLQMPSGGTASNIFGVGIIDVLDYANTNKNKTIRTIGGYDSNGSSNGQDYQYVGLVSNLAITQGTAATTSFTLACYVYAGGSGFATGTTAVLYGVK